MLLVTEYFANSRMDTQGHSLFESLVSYLRSAVTVSFLYHFQDRARYLSKIAIFLYSACIQRPR